MKLWESKPGVIIGTVGVLMGTLLVWGQSRSYRQNTAIHQLSKLRVPPANSKSNLVQFQQASTITDTHDFMEYFFEPPFERIMSEFDKGEFSDREWDAVQSDALIIAEGATLLLLHEPEEDPEAWREFAKMVRDSGEEFYQAVEARDFAKSETSFRAMTENCNQCHQSHADGNYQFDF